MAKLLSEGLQCHVPQIKPNPNGCQYTLINYIEWYLLFQMTWILTGPPRVSDLPTALVKNVTFTNFCLDSLHSATASFWSSINLQKSLFHLIYWSINTFKPEVSEENWVLGTLLNLIVFPYNTLYLKHNNWEDVYYESSYDPIIFKNFGF